MSQPMRSGVPAMELPDLAELDLPAAVGMFPQTLAWKLLLAAVVLVLLVVLLLRYRRYVRRRWKRQATALALAALESASAGAWFELIKRVCLVHMSREQVAALDDAAVLARLTHLDEPARKSLLAGHYRRQERLADEANEGVHRAFVRWLKELPDGG
ncbi:hypothetical protein D9M68_224010 [compost metagenome]